MNMTFSVNDAVGSETGWVYCLNIIGTDLCKIGKSSRTDLRARIEEHQKNSYYACKKYELEFAWAYPDEQYERAIHRELKQMGLLPPMSEMGSYEVFRIAPKNALAVAKEVIERRTPHLPADAIKYLNDDLLEGKVIKFLHMVLENQKKGLRDENKVTLDMACNLAGGAS